jgi:hypothetical protein
MVELVAESIGLLAFICDNAEALAGAKTDVRRCSDALGPRKKAFKVTPMHKRKSKNSEKAEVTRKRGASIRQGRQTRLIPGKARLCSYVFTLHTTGTNPRVRPSAKRERAT